MNKNAAANPTGEQPPANVPAVMRGWSQHRYGGPEVVRWSDLAVAVPAAGEVLLKVRATGLNAADVHVMRGDPFIVRTAFGIRRPRKQVRGHDVAGTVVALGDGVTEFQLGDEVVGELAGGGLAEFAVAGMTQVVRRPHEVDATVAAALPMAGVTAWQALDKAVVAEGQRILVVGASTGVGTMAVQLARHRGAHVWALCGERSRSLVQKLGAERTFDYRQVQPGAIELAPEATGGGFDAVIVMAGTAPLRQLQKLVRRGGSVVLVSGEGSRVLGPLGRMLAASIISIGSKRPIRSLAAVATPSIVAQLLDLTVDGSLEPVIERTWALNEADAALSHIDSGRTVGKVVVTTVEAR